MRVKSRLLGTLLLLFFITAISSENQPAIEQLTSNNGLSHNTIRCMLQDRTGFLWFGSLNGLNRYDGVKIKSLIPDAINPTTLSSGKIKELHEDSYGHIWVRTYGDMMHCYDPLVENFIPIFENKADQAIKHNLYYEDKQKNIWLGSVTDGCVKISFDDNKINLRKFTTNQTPDILSSNVVNDIFQDSNLNTWILTSKGITKVAGNTSEVFGGVGTASYIKAYESNKKLYFITDMGKVVVYNPATKRVDKAVPVNLATKILKTCFFKNNTILFSTENKGVFLFNTTTGQLTTTEAAFGERINANATFLTDELGDVWIYNLSGNVWLLSPAKNNITKLNLIPGSTLQLIDEERYQFVADKHGNVWITTYGNGLFRYNVSTGNLSHFSYNKNTNGLASNYLLSIVLDKNNNIWVGTESMGINKLSFSNRNVQILFPDPESAIKSVNVIKAFLEDKNRNIWVSTKAGNLYLYDQALLNKKTIFENGYNVYSMLQDKNGTVWLATKRSGIIEMPDGKLSKAKYYLNNGKPGSLSNNTVFSLLKDKKDRLWAATFGGGICVKLPGTGPDVFRTFFNNDNWIRFTRYIFMDRKGDLWVATTNGVLRFNPDELLKNSKAYKYYTFNVASKNCLSNPEVRYIFQDSKANIWLATAGGGVNKFIGETPEGNGIFDVYRNQQGIATDNVMSIEEDKTGCFWISTESGLHKFNPQTKLFQYYKFTDDFSSNIFSETASLKCHDGKMLWGSLNGFYAFYPESLVSSKQKNTVVLTGFSIYDQEAKIDSKNAPLEQSVTFSKNVTLKASEKVFHIEFSNLNFSDPKANQFMYILDGYEKRWNVSGSYNLATYRNVPPGTYTFMVKSVNSEGVWDDNVTKLEIEILPPIWQSGWAIFIYMILLGAAAYFAYGLALKFYRLNNAVKVERQLTDYKLRFFTNISHEFRTPLTLIKGSVDTLNELKTKMTEPLQHLVSDLDKNTSHLLRLIDQLMEFRKLQNNKQQLQLQKTDAILFLNDIYKSFSNVAAKMNIEYSYLPAGDSIEMYLDRNKVDKIVFNLLSNAFKFTPRGGKISLTTEVDEDTQMLSISVSDNGIGIPKEKQNLLFSRFMQINFSSNGTGVGLSLVNEFTTLHKGTVQFSENEGGGSVFTVNLSLDGDVYSDDDFVNEQIVVKTEDKHEVYNISEFIDNSDRDALLNLLPNAPTLGKKYKILVIDDNDDIRDFLTEKLSPYFEVITAEDGNVGINKSMEDDPDLIICDVMMPGMNGFDLTKKLKDDFATCHIPVILLTAYVSDEHNTEGIEAGADAYISKPFSMTHLMLQINKLIEKRERLNMHYAGNEVLEPVGDETLEEMMPDRDNQFLKLVEELLEKHLTDPEFSVDDFAQMTNTGRTLFFKKIKYLTGYTPNEFIRARRMKKAAELLKTYKYNVSEVSYMVGINDPFYFSKCFKAQFGCSPSRYLNSL
ncbi:MAG: two-component regulator propeller domain-containing protein [Paludibacter sp.]|nr:two-component regulator propeller domain-containing protein [Paludibacter sp.]